MTAEIIRESVIAGSWYPGQPSKLKHEIKRYLDGVTISPSRDPLFSLIVPHAGYMYSGGVAAHAYKLLEGGSFHTVLILAPSHRAYFQGASIYDLGGFSTPLGVVPLDRKLVDALLHHSIFKGYLSQAHDQEHSLEIQLPFLQCVLREFHLVPVVMGNQSRETCQKIAEAISQECRGKSVLLLASSDLSHYHPDGEARKLDQVVLDRISAFDPEGLAVDLESGRCEACGGGPMVTVMLASRKLGARRSQVLRYANSGDITGDRRNVVGYIAAAFFGVSQEVASTSVRGSERMGVDLGLSEAEKKTLREIALEAIRCRCLKRPMPEIKVDSPKLSEPRGAFVSLHLDGELKGCIGMVEPRKPLHQTVQEMAVQAAFADPRFCPLRPEEMGRIELEISVLTPIEPLRNISEIQIGKHGLLLRKGSKSGLLLPQVALEHGWDVEQFLQWTCRKAGLSVDAWKDPDAEIFVFSADIF